MATKTRVLGALVLGLLCLTVAACGNDSSSAGTSDIQVLDITSPLPVLTPTPFTITGLNFLSVAGADVTVRFTAESGTPFDGGTSTTIEVAGVAASNTTVTGTSPTSGAAATFNAFVTVILPSTAEGTSTTAIAVFLGSPSDAQDDAYDITGNGRLARDAAGGVLANDQPAGFVTVVNFDAASTNGGDIVMNADGSFTYDPPRGFEGADTFTYEIAGGTGTDTATVTITVAGMVWFIDRSAAAGGDGRQATPFDDIAPFAAIQGVDADPGDTVYLYEAGGTPYNGPLTLLTDQHLIGQGVDLLVGTDVLIPASGNPVLDSASAATLILGQDNTVRGLDVGNSAGTGIWGVAVGTLSLDTVDVATTGGPALHFDGLTVDATFGSLASTTSASYGLLLDTVGGTLTVTGTTTVAGPAIAGVFIDAGTAAVTLNQLEITTTTADGLVTTAGTTLTITGTGSFVATTTGRPLGIQSTIGAAGITFEQISCDGALNGIFLSDTGTLGGLTVTGDGSGSANGSGGTLLNCTGSAIRLTNTQDVSLAQLDIDTSGEHGIFAEGVTGLLYEDASVTAAGDSDDEYGIWLQNAYGSVLIEDVEFDDINEDAIQLVSGLSDDATVDTFTLRRLSFLDHTAAGFGEHAIDVQAAATANMDVLVDDCTFDLNAEALVGVLGVSTGTSALVLTVEDSTFNGGAAFGSGCVQLHAAGSSTATFNVLTNDLNLSDFTSILVNNDDEATSFVTIRDNDIDASAASNNGYGISLRQDENGTCTALLEDNTVDGHGFDGVRVLARDTTDGTGTMNVTILGNTIGVPFSFGAGIALLAQDTNTLCANVAGNSPSGSNFFPGSDEDILVSEGVTATLLVTQLAPSPAVDPSEIDDANSGATVGVVGSPLWGQPACPVPPVVP